MGFFTPKISAEDMKTVKRLLRESNELAQAANTCVTPSVFFERYDAFIETLRELTKYEKYRVFKGNLPRVDLKRAQQQEQNEVNAMIQRSYLHTRQKAEKMDEPAARQELFDAYFEAMEPFVPRMNRFNRKVVEDLQKIARKQAQEMGKKQERLPEN